MKIGASTYSLSKAIKAGTFDLMGTFDWLAENGADHIEIVPLRDVFSFADTPELVPTMAAKAQAVGLEISCYTFGAMFGERLTGVLDQQRVQALDNGLRVGRYDDDLAHGPLWRASDETGVHPIGHLLTDAARARGMAQLDRLP